MRIHHLDCATLCTAAGRFAVGPDHPGLVCHCLLLETEAGLVLVDSGIGTHDVHRPDRLGRAFLHLVRPLLDPERTAVRQIERLGFSAADVRHVVLTHLDVDHAGGLSDFPHAKVHVTLQEHEAAMLADGIRARRRYRERQWAHWPDFELYLTRGVHWHGLEAIDLRGVPDTLLVPLFGHTQGHAGVAVRDGEQWWLHAGDAYFHRAELEGGRPPVVLGLMERFNESDRTARLASLDGVRRVARQGVRVFSAHDPVEFQRSLEA
jgi:glyoxylase-like metal-dependent hydrolase (beta-lactamase superfamily II)